MKTHTLSVLVAASEHLDIYSLTQALAEKGISNLIQTTLDEEQIIKQVVKHGHEIVVLDVSLLSIEQAKTMLSTVKLRTGAQVVAVGDNREIAFYRAMLSAGACDYLLNPVEISAFNETEFQVDKAETTAGKVIAVVGAKGGVGVSSIAANLARELAERGEVLTVADMDFATGDLDLQYDVQGNTALVEMLQYPERLEPVVYERSGIKVSDRVTLFTGYLSLDSTPFWPEKSALDHFRKFSLQHSDTLVLDLPSFSMRDQIGFSSLAEADVRVLVLEPTLSSIRNIGQILALLDSSANGQSDKINLLVLNHTKSDKASLINCHGVQRALGCEVDVILPYVPTHFLTKESLGRSLLKGNRKVSRAFDLLASKATGGDTTTKRRRWLRGA
jgi:pilus assembly protein CpaE